MREGNRVTLELVKTKKPCDGCVFEYLACRNSTAEEFNCGTYGDSFAWRVVKMPAPPQACA